MLQDQCSALYDSNTTGTAGRTSVCSVVITSLAATSFGPSLPSLDASTRISPGCFVLCKITCARPLNSDRLGSLSLSWQLGGAIPDAKQLAIAGNFKPDIVVRCWNRTSFLVEYFDLEDRHILAIRVDFGPICRQSDRGRGTGRFVLPCQIVREARQELAMAEQNKQLPRDASPPDMPTAEIIQRSSYLLDATDHKG
jgi:hypothetical protein